MLPIYYTYMAVIEFLNLKALMYVGFRFAPFILVSYFIVSSIFNADIRGIVVLTAMGVTGYLVGWRPTSGIFNVLLGFIFLLVFGFAMSWIGVLIGLSVREERVATNATFIAVFPLTFLSNAFAPTTGMPKPLQYIAEWNPVSTMVAGCRELFGLKNEFGATAGSFPSENPLMMSVIYMILIMAVFIPLSVRKYNNANKK